jgi:hypothetical protein
MMDEVAEKLIKAQAYAIKVYSKSEVCRARYFSFTKCPSRTG